MHYKDNFENAVSRIVYAHSVLHNSGFYCSERDFDLAQRLKQLLNDIADSRCYYDENASIKDHTIQSLLQYAEGKSLLNGSNREGVVFKSNTVHDRSWKAISNSWLLKNE